MSTAKLAPWQQNITSLAIIYAALEQGRKFPMLLEGDDVFLGPILDDMNRQGLIEPSRSRQEWLVTEQGDGLRARMVGMYDQLLKFEVFGTVNQALQLTEAQSPDGAAVFDDILDPRFTPSPESEDLRLAVLTWFALAAEEQLAGKQVDPYQVVFMQKLRAGHYNGQKNQFKSDFWFNLRLGTIYTEIQQIVDTAVKWTDMAGDVDSASAAMNAIYSAGMSEQVKRDGERCGCGCYLGMYAYYAAKDGTTLDTCPSCKGSFNPPPPAGQAGESCPNCQHDILPRHRKCRGCGAKIDRSMAAGSVSEVTTETTYYETYTTDYYSPWGSSYMSYGYYPPAPLYYGVYYDPYDPLLAVASFGLLCALL